MLFISCTLLRGVLFMTSSILLIGVRDLTSSTFSNLLTLLRGLTFLRGILFVCLSCMIYFFSGLLVQWFHNSHWFRFFTVYQLFFSQVLEQFVQLFITARSARGGQEKDCSNEGLKKCLHCLFR